MTDRSIFVKGQRVLYMPPHVLKNPLENKDDCEKGVVKRANEEFVYVIFDGAGETMTTGDEPYTACVCRYENLIPIEE